MGWVDKMAELPGKIGRVVGSKVARRHPAVVVEFDGEDQYFGFPHQVVAPSNALVHVSSNLTTVREESAGLAEWRPHMASYGGMHGILQSRGNGIMKVKFGDGKLGVFSPTVVNYVLSPGDRVRLAPEGRTQLWEVLRQPGASSLQELAPVT